MRGAPAPPPFLMLSASIEFDDFHRQFTRAAREAIREAAAEGLRSEASRLRGEVALQFASEGRHGDSPWAPRRLRSTISDSRRLLINTGRLRRSLVDADDPEHVERISGESLLFGSLVPYAGFHQRGARFLVARPLLTPSMLGGNALASFP